MMGDKEVIGDELLDIMEGGALPFDVESWSEEEDNGESPATSGKGYSNRVEFVTKGVPIIWEDGEWRTKSSRFVGIAVPIGSRLGRSEGFEANVVPLL